VWLPDYKELLSFEDLQPVQLTSLVQLQIQQIQQLQLLHQLQPPPLAPPIGVRI
jgi:hypothetical protein